MKATLELEDIAAIGDYVIEKLKPIIQHETEDIILDVHELSKYLIVSHKWIYERVQFKEIPYMKVKGFLRFRKAHIDKWLSSYSIPAINRQRGLLKAVK